MTSPAKKPSEVAIAKLDRAMRLLNRAQRNYEMWQSRMGTATGRAAVERGDRQWEEAERLFAEVRQYIAERDQ